jgi:hypothetical protein
MKARIDFREWRIPGSDQSPTRLALLAVLLHECPTASDLETFLVGTVWPYYRPDGSRPSVTTRDAVNAWDRIRREWHDIMRVKRTRGTHTDRGLAGWLKRGTPLVDPLAERKRLKREREKDLRWLAREKEKEAQARFAATLKGE